MSGRGLERDPRGRTRWPGRGRRRGRGSPPPIKEKQDPKFKGANPELPTLNYGASAKENRPIEFLREFGEYCAIHYKGCIAPAFWTTPPAYGEEEVEPIMPDPIPNNNMGKAILSEYNSDKKEWKLEKKKIIEQIGFAFSTVHAQLSELSISS
jgi:hypothetical protein